MTLVYFFIFLLITATLYALVHRLIRGLNLSSELRFYQCRQIVLFGALILLFGNPLSYNAFLYLADALLNIDLVRQFANSALVGNTSRVSYLYIVYLISNLLFMFWIFFVVFILYRCHIIRRIVSIPYLRGGSRLDGIRYLPWAWAGRYYQFYDQEGDILADEDICLTERGIVARQWLRAMKHFFFAVIAIEFAVGAISLIFEIPFLTGRLEQISKAIYILPVALYLFIEQLEYSLAGDEQSGTGSVSNDSISDWLVGNMEAMMIYYQKKFGDALLYAEAFNDQGQQEGIVMNDVENRLLESCHRPELLQIITKAIKEAGNVLDDQYLNGLCSLLNGECVHIRDNILGQFTLYLANYLNCFIIQDRTALILCGNESDIHNIKKVMETAFASITGITCIWNIGGLEELETGEDMQILICTYQDVENRSLPAKRADFFDRVFCTVFTDGADFFSRNGIEINVLFGEMEKINSRLQYVFLSEDNNESLRTAFEYYLDRQMHPFSSERQPANMIVMGWKGESSYKLQRCLNVGTDASAYMGTGLPLALAALHCDAPDVDYISSTAVPYHSYSDAMQKMSGQIMQRVLRPGMDFVKGIRFNRFRHMNRQELQVLVVHDENYNCVNAAWPWMRYGGTACTMLHVISKTYMLRDYLGANFRWLVSDQNLYEAFASYKTDMDVSRAVGLLIELCSPSGVPEQSLRKMLKDNKWKAMSTEEMLSECIRMVIRKEEFHDVYEYFSFEKQREYFADEDDFREEWIIRLTNEEVKELIRKKTAYANIRLSKSGIRQIPVLKGDVYNYFLEGQIHCFGGYTYRVRQIDENYIHLEEVLLDREYEYFPVFGAKFREMKQENPLSDTDIVDKNLYRAVVEKKIYGYWQLTDGNNLSDAEHCKPYRVNKDENGGVLRICKENVSVLELVFTDPCIAGKEEKCAVLLTVMLNEIFKTLFPQTWQNIFACTRHSSDGDEDKNLWNGKSTFEQRLMSIIPHAGEDSRDDEEHVAPGYEGVGLRKNADGKATIYIVEFSCLEFGMIPALISHIDRLYTVLKEYLSWTKENEGREGIFLKYGGADLPELFAVEETLELLTSICPRSREVTEEQRKCELEGRDNVCTFCGRVSLFAHKMQDGRIMCNYCKNHQLTEKQEVRDMFSETRSFLERQYEINIPKNIHVRFKSATAIQRQTGYSGQGRVLGFYQPSTKQLWIESRGPKICVQSTLMHEMTHGWQYAAIDVDAIMKEPAYGLSLIEGHTSYVEVEGMRLLKQPDYSRYLETELLARDDEYGRGYRMVKELLEARKETKGNQYNVYELMRDISRSLTEHIPLGEI